MNAVKQFNGLNGAVVTRRDLEKLIELAKDQEQPEVMSRLQKVLSNFKDEKFEIDLSRQAVECVPASLLPLLDEAPELPDESEGLGKAVSPDDIYTMITNKMISFINEANEDDYKKKWEGKVYGTGYLIPFNFQSKKRYRGINFYMLRDFDKPLENPFYLTFKQVGELGGKVKKGSFGHEVVYFTRLYTYSQNEPKLEFGTYDEKKFKKWFNDNKHLIPEKEHQKDHSIPILKYYKVFNGKDIEGIDFDLENFKIGYINNELPADEPMPIADAIIENYPAPKVPIKHGGDKAVYYPGLDYIKMPHKPDFETAQDYYRTLFHELGHSTGHPKRLKRDLSGRFGSKKYAFEELIAELNAVFVSAEAGFLWHTNKNHAAYIKGWNRALTHIKDDNRFVMRAATQAQKATDFILQPDADGNPIYLKTLKVATKTKKNTTKKTKSVTKPEKVGFMLVDNITSETVATKKTLPELERAFQNLKKQKDFQDMEPLVYEIVKKGNKNVPGEKIKVDWLKPVKKTKAELEAANPKGFAKKPKSIAISTAIKDVLSLPKYKGKINERQAAILYKHFKNSAFGSEIFSDITSDYERGILKKENEMYDFAISNDQLEITEFGMEFIQAVNGRRESLLNQKNNLALFEGLKGKIPFFKSRKEAKKYFLNWARKNLKGKKVHHKELRKDVLFSMSGINHSISKELTIPKAALILQAEEMLKNSKYLLSEPDKLGRKQIVAVHKMAATGIVEGKETEILITLREGANGVIYYDHEIDGVKKLPSTSIGLKRPTAKRSKEVSRAKAQRKDTKKTKTTKKGLKSPNVSEPKTEQIIPLQPEPQQPAQQIDRGDQVVPAAPVRKKSLMDMEFDSLEMDEGWEHFMQHPAANMKIAIYGKPKNGKTSGALKFVHYLTKHGSVLYNFADQGFNKSTKDLWITSGLANKPNATPSDIDNLNDLEAEIRTGKYKIVVIDMINDYINREGIKPQEFKDRFIKKYPNVSFILVFEVTKDGNFKGDQGWTHIVDAIFTVENFLMENRGRYGIGHFIVWEEGLKKFNPKRYEEIMEETQASTIEPETPEPIEVETIPDFCITEV